MKLHTDRGYEADLKKLREQVLLMGARIEEMIANCSKALSSRDAALAQEVIERDHDINTLELEIDELCLRILALRHPVANDLRFITTALKLVTDIERIGDLAVNVCERVIELNAEPPLKDYADLERMATAVQTMVREVLDAFVRHDVSLAQRVIDRDRVVDAFYAQTFRELLTTMMENRTHVYRATRLQSVAKYLERMGDHATNLAELVIFMAKGTDVRHHKLQLRHQHDELKDPE